MVKAYTLADLEKQNDSVHSTRTQFGNQTSQNQPYHTCSHALKNIKNFLFEGFSFKTITFAIIVIQLIAFIIELSVDRSGIHFVTPISNETLGLLGGFSWEMIRKFHFHRFFISPIYNYTLLSLITSALFHAFTGFRLEKAVHRTIFIAIYVVSGIVSLLSSGVYNQHYVIVGSYCQCCAMIAAYGCYIIYRSAIEGNKDVLQVQLLIFSMIFIMLIIPYNLVFRTGELAGFFTGSLIQLLCIFKEGQRSKYVIGGLVLSAGGLAILIIYSLVLVFTS